MGADSLMLEEFSLEDEYYDSIKYNGLISPGDDEVVFDVKQNKRDEQIPASLKGFVRPQYLRSYKKKLQGQMVQFKNLLKGEHDLLNLEKDETNKAVKVSRLKENLLSLLRFFCFSVLKFKKEVG